MSELVLAFCAVLGALVLVAVGSVVILLGVTRCSQCGRWHSRDMDCWFAERRALEREYFEDRTPDSWGNIGCQPGNQKASDSLAGELNPSRNADVPPRQL